MFTGSVWAQSVISAHSGTIHYKEGQVELDGKSVDQDSSKGQFGEVKTGQTLTVKDGQAEILLTPGVFLRVGENSSFTMLSNKLSDTRIEVLSGTAMVEVGELLQDNAITVKFHDSEIALGKKGLYRIDSDPARLRVYDGEAKVTTASQESALAVRKGHELLFGETLEAKAFDAKQTDAFYNWNARRDEYIAEANIYAAKSARDSGYGFGSGYSAFGTTGAYANGFGNGFGSWMYNPYFGMFTYMPFDGMFFSPFGYSYFSPGMVGYLYMPGSPFYYGGGYPTGVATARNGGSGLTPRSSGSPSGIVNRGGFTPGGFAGSRASSGGLGGVSASSGGGASSGVSRGGSGGMSSGGGGAHAGGGARR
jgi:hypothetical protein